MIQNLNDIRRSIGGVFVDLGNFAKSKSSHFHRNTTSFFIKHRFFELC